MTEHEISNLQPGQELDRLVAEACGIETQFLGHERRYDAVDGNLIPSCPRCGQTGQQARSDVAVVCHRPFRPSTDWNHAMRALAKADLGGRFSMGQDFDGSWWVSNGWFELVQSSTGPLAICRAILQWKQDDNEDS